MRRSEKGEKKFEEKQTREALERLIAWGHVTSANWVGRRASFPFLEWRIHPVGHYEQLIGCAQP